MYIMTNKALTERLTIATPLIPPGPYKPQHAGTPAGLSLDFAVAASSRRLASYRHDLVTEPNKMPHALRRWR
jgi:hypothetical protein